MEQWHILTRKIDNPSIKNPDSYVMEWQLPADLACDHCVVQVLPLVAAPPVLMVYS